MSSKDILEFTIVLSFISKYVGKKKNTRVYIEMIEGRKEGRKEEIGVYVAFNSLHVGNIVTR